MKTNDFNKLHWHDAVIKLIKIDRNQPGIEDSIELEVEWPDVEEKSKLVFEDVYFANMNLNFGIIADESILVGYELIENQNDPDLNNLFVRWRGKINLDLKVYLLKFNSTDSEIKIIAKSFCLERKAKISD